MSRIGPGEGSPRYGEGVDPLDPRQDGGSFDGERVEEDDEPALPESTRDDTDAGWGERSGSNDDWLIEERPPHWDHP